MATAVSFGVCEDLSYLQLVGQYRDPIGHIMVHF